MAAVTKKAAFIIAQLFALLLVMCAAGVRSVQTNYAGDVPMWNHIMNSEPQAGFAGIPRGIILPHHTMTATMAARFYAGLAQRVSPRRIVIIAPNHYESGDRNIVTADNVVYPTVFGNLEVDHEASAFLSNRHGIRVDDSVFVKEHAVYYHSPFIKKFFPEAKIVPVLVKWDAERGELDDLASALLEITGDETLVLASADFSHYNRRYTADYHDESSYSAIVNFEMEWIFNAEIDSPGSIYVLEKIMAAKGYLRCERIFHTNSEDFTKRHEAITTSHQYFAFYSGKPLCRKVFTMMACGDIGIANDSLSVLNGWRWQRCSDLSGDRSINRYLSIIRGEEDRFLSGYNLYLFDLARHDDVIHYSINGLNVTVTGADSYIPGDDEFARIKKLAGGSDCTVVFVYPGEGIKPEIKRTGRKLADSGADIVIFKNSGRKAQHEFYKGRLIIYSLGDFITAGSDSSGEICQVLVSEGRLKADFIPIEVKDGFPVEAAFR